MKTAGVALLLLIILFACKTDGGKERSNQLYVVATTGMIGDAVKNIVKDKAEVETLMGPGVDPHLYKATQSDLSKLNKADIIFYNGLYLEGKMEEILKKIGEKKTVRAIGESLDKNKLINVSGGYGSLSYDPHIWFDVKLWSQAVASINETMKQADKKNAAFYQENFEAYQKKLLELDEWVKEQITQIPVEGGILITSHDAFEYFGKAYNLEVEGLQGISTVSDFGLQDISKLVDKIIERKVKAVFVETSVSERSLLAVIEGCGEKGHEVKIGGTLYSDAMGESGTKEGTYIGMVKHNVNFIVEALK